MCETNKASGINILGGEQIKLRADVNMSAAAQGYSSGAVLGQRERTARESLEHEAKQAILRAAAIHGKIDSLDREYGKSLLELPESKFRERFSMDIWGPF